MSRTDAGQLALMVEKAAACASRAWLRFCSTEYSCMKPFTKRGLQHSSSFTQRLASRGQREAATACPLEAPAHLSVEASMKHQNECSMKAANC